MHRFFSANLSEVPGEVVLNADESHHLCKVVRLDQGEIVEVFNGNGLVGTGPITVNSAKASVVRIESIKRFENRSRIHLVFGLPKPAASEFIVRKITEIGVGTMTPVISEFSKHSQAWNPDRWERILFETLKQCQDPFLPELKKPKKLLDVLNEISIESQIILCDEEARNEAIRVTDSVKNIFLFVGAEGGWSSTERKLFVERGALKLGLGKNRLRAETATLVATVLMKQLAGEL